MPSSALSPVRWRTPWNTWASPRRGWHGACTPSGPRSIDCWIPITPRSPQHAAEGGGCGGSRTPSGTRLNDYRLCRNCWSVPPRFSVVVGLFGSSRLGWNDEAAVAGRVKRHLGCAVRAAVQDRRSTEVSSVGFCNWNQGESFGSGPGVQTRQFPFQAFPFKLGCAVIDPSLAVSQESVDQHCKISCHCFDCGFKCG
jgi:hypothetical protein